MTEIRRRLTVVPSYPLHLDNWREGFIIFSQHHVMMPFRFLLFHFSHTDKTKKVRDEPSLCRYFDSIGLLTSSLIIMDRRHRIMTGFPRMICSERRIRNEKIIVPSVPRLIRDRVVPCRIEMVPFVVRYRFMRLVWIAEETPTKAASSR